MFDMTETKKSIGEVSAVVMAEFLKAGFPVLLPFGDSQRYDLVVEAGGRFLRVQCKTASPCGWRDDRSCIRFKARSGTHHSVPYRDQADLFAAYAPSTRQVYVLPVDEVPETDVWLRLMPAKNNQHLRVRLAEEHTLKAWVARQGSAASSASDILSSPPGKA